MEYSDLNNNNQTQQQTGSCNGVLYTIRRGDTLYKLSRRYNVSLSTIMNANPNVNVYNLQVGQQICIPGRTSMGSGTQSGTGQMNQGMPNRRPVTNNRYPEKVKGDQFQNFECPACPTCPEQQPCEACPEQQPCPTCPEQQPCPTCPEQQPCPTCPECPICRECPVCPTCPECETCPEQQPCPTCPTCPECEVCPEQQPCPTCPTCPEQMPCPSCPECEVCPEQMPCPSCPEQQPCPTCPEQMPCPTCKNQHTVIFVGPKYEKAVQREKPACMKKPVMECKKPMMECKKPAMECRKSKCMPCDSMKYEYMGDTMADDMDARMWNRSSYGCNKNYDMGYRAEYRMDYDRDDRMDDVMDYSDYYMGGKSRRMMEYRDSDCGCKSRKMMEDRDSDCGCKNEAAPMMDKRNMAGECHKMAPDYGCKAENKCYDTDYMDYQKKMYRGCFKKAVERPCDCD